jgi:hypothetical protein
MMYLRCLFDLLGLIFAHSLAFWEMISLPSDPWLRPHSAQFLCLSTRSALAMGRLSGVTVVAVVVERIDVMGGKGTATAPGGSGGSGGRAWRMGGRRDGGWQR